MADHDGEGAAGLESVSDPVGGEVSAPAAIMPEGGGAPSNGRRPKWLVPLVVAVVVVVVVVAGLVGWRVVESRRHDAALDSCSRAVKALKGKTGSDQLAQYREAAGIKADQVKDAKTVVAMARSVKDAEGIRQQTIRCKASMPTDGLKEAADQAGKIDGKYAALSKAARAVIASRDAKALEDAKASLAQAVSAAQGTLDSSNGKVADNKTRETLQQAIDAANKVLAGKSVKDPQKYRDAEASLTSPVNGVNDSVAAKAAADTAAAQAAQSQPQPQSKSSSGSSSSGSSGSTKRRLTGGSSGSATTNRSDNNSHSGSGSNHSNSGGSTESGSGFDLTPSKPIQGCVDGNSVCPIG